MRQALCLQILAPAPGLADPPAGPQRWFRHGHRSQAKPAGIIPGVFIGPQVHWVFTSLSGYEDSASLMATTVVTSLPLGGEGLLESKPTQRTASQDFKGEKKMPSEAAEESAVNCTLGIL